MFKEHDLYNQHEQQYLEIADRVSILDDFRIEGIASYAGQTFTPVIKLEEQTLSVGKLSKQIKQTLLETNSIPS